MSNNQHVTPAQKIPFTAQRCTGLVTSHSNSQPTSGLQIIRLLLLPVCSHSRVRTGQTQNCPLNQDPNACRTLHEIVAQGLAQHSPPAQQMPTALLSPCNIHSKHTTLQCCSAHTQRHMHNTLPQADPERQVNLHKGHLVPALFM